MFSSESIPSILEQTLLACNDLFTFLVIYLALVEISRTGRNVVLAFRFQSLQSIDKLFIALLEFLLLMLVSKSVEANAINFICCSQINKLLFKVSGDDFVCSMILTTDLSF